MAINLIDTGAVANDGTGDPIRTAFQTVNSNFDYINGGLFAGTVPTIISALSVTSDYFIANTYIEADSVISNTVISNGNLYVSKDGAYIIGDVNIVGNLNISGAQAASQSQTSTASILNLHYSATPLVIDDSADIGLEWQYFKGIEKRGFLGWQNSTQSLVYLDDVTEGIGNIITSGTFGNVQLGSLMISNTTSATSNVTGALQVRGGVGIQGNTYIQSNLFVGTNANIGNLSVTGFHVGNMYFGGSDTIFINGSPVQTAATAFNGGTVGLPTTFSDLTAATSTTTGAVRINGGLGIAGNLWASNIHVPAAGHLRGNLIGTIVTSAQTNITSLGTLTGLSINGQLNVNDISPNGNQLYSLGTSNTNRWLKLWTYDIDVSGAITGGTINSTGGIHTGIIDITNNTQAVSTTTGALQVRGGASIEAGNLYIGGSGGVAIVATGHILPTANITSNIGSPTSWFSNIHATTFRGTSVTAQYADLAELYRADANYEPGTVVVFGGDAEITVTSDFADHRVAGVISTNPAYLMNSAVDGLPVALRGRVPVRVIGPVAKGDLLVTSTTPGYAQSVGSDTGYGLRIFAKALEINPSNKTKIIEAVIL